VEERHRLEFLAGLGREILQEVEHQLAEILVRRRRAEEIFQPALRQRRLGGISIDEGHACALGGLACRGSDRGEVGADEGLDLLLADETLGFALAHLRLALVVDHDKDDLGAAETRQALVPGERQREIGALVDDLGGRLDRGHRVDANLRGRARQRIEHSNLDLLLCLRGCCAAQHCDARESDNSEPHCSAPFAFVFVPLVRIRTGSLLRSFPRKRESRVPVCGLWVPAFANERRISPGSNAKPHDNDRVAEYVCFQSSPSQVRPMPANARVARLIGALFACARQSVQLF